MIKFMILPEIKTAINARIRTENIGKIVLIKCNI